MTAQPQCLALVVNNIGFFFTTPQAEELAPVPVVVHAHGRHPFFEGLFDNTILRSIATHVMSLLEVKWRRTEFVLIDVLAWWFISEIAAGRLNI